MNKNMIARIFSLALAAILLIGLIAPAVFAAETDGVTIKLHYHRPDGVYDDWGVWFWSEGKDGADYPFAEENGEMVATYSVPDGTMRVGFIVKLPNWADKDVSSDQFIDVSTYTSGTVHVYVESKVEGFEIKLDDDVTSGIKLRSVTYEDGEGFLVKATSALADPETAFILQSDDYIIPISSVIDGGNGKYTLVPASEIDPYGSYTLTFDGTQYSVTMPNVYSTDSFEEEFTYTGDDLGAIWTAEYTSFRLWAPTAAAVSINLYESGTEGTDDLIEQIPMESDVCGTWVATLDGDHNGVYYTYSVTVNGETVEACDPYARTTGVNGKRAMIIDLDSTDPAGWENDTDPHADQGINDAIIYELHVRDLSMDDESGITNKGKFLGLIETGTVNASGISTGLDHMKELGITHLHLLPSYDYGSVDETKLDTAQFNWGYDPVNYNVPEGSYSTDPYNGEVRVREMKQMVQGLHENGISVVMDVVYNHVQSASDFCFNKIVPDYFTRISDSGVYSNGSGCGNDTASERSMVRKYIVDSVLYWVEEYHIDGFRFDLVGLLDTQTVNEIVETVHEKHPNVIFYGEGWTMSTNVTKDGYTLATQTNSAETPDFAYFSDNIRDALKGNIFNDTERGYVSGGGGKYNIVSAMMATPSWTSNPTQIINYASCHDNMTLFDRLTNSTPDATVEERIQMNNLAAAIYMSAQGTPFMQAGEEMLRTKVKADGTFDSNSYSSSDEVNCLKWGDLSDEAYQQVFDYYKGLIAFRKAHSALRMTTAKDVATYLSSVGGQDANVTAFHIKAGANGEENELFLIFNPNSEATTVTLPEGNWNIYVQDGVAGTTALATATGSVTVNGISAMYLVNDAQTPVDEAQETVVTTEVTATEPTVNTFPTPIVIAVIAVIAVAAIVAGILISKKNKKQ